MSGMDFDDILKNVGQFGTFQKVLLALVAVPCMITTWQCFLHAFIGFIPAHRCHIEHCDNATTEYMVDWLNNTVPGEYEGGRWVPDECHRYLFQNTTTDEPQCSTHWAKNVTVKCSHWKFDKQDMDSTIATEWQLVCGKEYLVSLVGSINLAGGLLGLAVMGYLSDRFGRKVGILCCLTLLAVFGIGSALSPNLYVLMGFRFLVEAVETSLFQLLFVLVTEFLGPDKRVIGAQIVQLMYSAGEMLLAAIAFVVRSWRTLQLATSVPALFFLSYYWFLPESARWLLANQKTDRANAIIKKMAHWNKTNVGEEMKQHYGTINSESPSNEPQLSPNVTNDQAKLVDDSVRKHQSSIDLFRSPRLRRRTLTIMACWLLNVLVYNGITLGSTGIPDSSAQLNFFLMGLVEIPANLLSLFTMHHFGRRITLSVSFVITGIPLVIIQFLPTGKGNVWATLAMTLLGKFGSTSGNAVLYLFSAELFPTVLRNSGLGMCGVVGTIAATFAPQVILFGRFQETLPYLVFGILSLFGTCLSLLLPETLGQRLPETTEDAEKFS